MNNGYDNYERLQSSGESVSTERKENRGNKEINDEESN